MSKPKVHVKKGDQVEVIAGKDKGRQGEILKVIPQESRVIVEGINIIKKHAQPTQDNPQGGIVEKEAPIHSSNVKLVCEHCNQPARTGKQFLDSGEKVRYCKNCDEIVD
ncbi:50S ribosomal protein L24 [Halanaerobaculum tunisiense]